MTQILNKKQYPKSTNLDDVYLNVSGNRMLNEIMEWEKENGNIPRYKKVYLTTMSIATEDMIDSISGEIPAHLVKAIDAQKSYESSLNDIPKVMKRIGRQVGFDFSLIIEKCKQQINSGVDVKVEIGNHISDYFEVGTSFISPVGGSCFGLDSDSDNLYKHCNTRYPMAKLLYALNKNTHLIRVYNEHNEVIMRSYITMYNSESDDGDYQDGDYFFHRLYCNRKYHKETLISLVVKTLGLKEPEKLDIRDYSHKYTFSGYVDIVQYRSNMNYVYAHPEITDNHVSEYVSDLVKIGNEIDIDKGNNKYEYDMVFVPVEYIEKNHEGEYELIENEIEIIDLRNEGANNETE